MSNVQSDYENTEGLNSVCVRNLHYDINNNRLREEFSKFGTIISSRVCTANGLSRGFAFVCFATAEEATKAVSEMNGKIIATRTLRVELAKQKATQLPKLIESSLARARANSLSSLRSYEPQNSATLLNRMLKLKDHGSTSRQPQNTSRNRIFGDRINRRCEGFQSGDRGPTEPIKGSNLYSSLSHSSQSKPQQIPLTADMLETLSPENQTQMLTLRLKPRVESFYDGLVEKVIHRLLQFDHTELLNMLDNEETFTVKIQETTVDVLETNEEIIEIL